MKERFLVMDVAKCHDCNNCFIACTDEHAENAWLPYKVAMPRHGHRWIDILRRERGENDRIDTAFLPKPCMQCGEPQCSKAGDFVKRRDDGIVIFDLAGGKGKDITPLCPYGSIWWNEAEHLPQKCDFCAHLLDDPSWEPGVPRCVHSCPTGALVFLTEEADDFIKYAAEEGLEPYKPELGAKPHVFYKNLHRFTKNFIAGQILKGGDVAPGVAVSLSGALGKAELATDIFGEFRFDGLDDGLYELSAAGKTLTKIELAGASVDAGDFEI